MLAYAELRGFGGWVATNITLTEDSRWPKSTTQKYLYHSLPRLITFVVVCVAKPAEPSLPELNK